MGLLVAVGSTLTNLGNEQALNPSITTILIKVNLLFILPPEVD